MFATASAAILPRVVSSSLEHLLDLAPEGQDQDERHERDREPGDPDDLDGEAEAAPAAAGLARLDGASRSGSARRCLHVRSTWVGGSRCVSPDRPSVHHPTADETRSVTARYSQSQICARGRGMRERERAPDPRLGCTGVQAVRRAHISAPSTPCAPIWRRSPYSVRDGLLAAQCECGSSRSHVLLRSAPLSQRERFQLVKTITGEGEAPMRMLHACTRLAAASLAACALVLPPAAHAIEIRFRSFSGSAVDGPAGRRVRGQAARHRAGPSSARPARSSSRS